MIMIVLSLETGLIKNFEIGAIIREVFHIKERRRFDLAKLKKIFWILIDVKIFKVYIYFENHQICNLVEDLKILSKTLALKL